MAQNVQTLYEFVNFCARKFQSGAISPDEFNTCLASANEDFIKQKTGLPEDFQVGLPYSRQQWQLSQIITEALKPIFVTPVTITKNTTDGLFHYPADYKRYSSIQIDYSKNPDDCDGDRGASERFVEVVSDAEWVIRLNNSVIQPTLLYPIANFYQGGIRVAPYIIKTIKMSYLKQTPTPFRGYTVVNDQDIYDPATSVQLVWDTSFYNDIAALILSYYGISIRDENLQVYAQNRQKQGI